MRVIESCEKRDFFKSTQKLEEIVKIQSANLLPTKSYKKQAQNVLFPLPVREKVTAERKHVLFLLPERKKSIAGRQNGAIDGSLG